MKTIFLFRISWFNPYTNPPEGKPRVLAEMSAEKSHPVPTEYQEVLKRLAPIGSGYGIGITCITPRLKDREWSVERKAANRRKLLQGRVNKAAPLFAEDIIKAEVAKKPEYFQGTSACDEAHDRVLQEQEETYKKWAENIGKLFVYEGE